MKHYTCARDYVTAFSLNISEKNRMHLARRNIKGKHDDEIQALCPDLKIEIIKRLGAQYKDEHNQYTIQITNHNNNMIVNYNCGTGINHEPTLTDVMWTLTQDASMLDSYLDMDDFLRDMGYDDDIDSVRKGEQIWRDVVKQTKELQKLRIPIGKLQELLQDY